jgi:hypothetical protein
MRPVGNCVNLAPILLLVLEMHEDEDEEENDYEDSPAVVDNACRAPSVSALRGSRSWFTIYETHLSAIETDP